MFVFPVSKAQKIPGAAILLLAKLDYLIVINPGGRAAGNNVTLTAFQETEQVLLDKEKNLPEMSREAQEPLELQGKCQPSQEAWCS